MMFFPAAILFLVSGVLSLPLFEKHEDHEPVDIISVKHLQINSYTGPLTAEMFKLLKNVEILELRESNFTLLEDRLLHNLPNLRKLSVSNSHIVREVHDISSCCQKLKEIEMMNSGLSSLPWNQIGVDWPIEKFICSVKKLQNLKLTSLLIES
ncbi:hypothetical protein WA026_019500 [Henosepilachna vigintioctopunctata]|uniref:Uncharacterized protein n=1 Tax=Henosepilachna vigintioctopunctata TaxID=420089 RepID=A0AAW1TPH2_9CUCU